MIDKALLESCSHKIRAIYNEDPVEAEKLIEKELKEILRQATDDEKKVFLRELSKIFHCHDNKESAEINLQSETLQNFFYLLLGKKDSIMVLPQEELLERALYSLNTVFDTLNQLFSVINKNLIGKEIDTEETIRWAIGSHMLGGDESISLEDYLNRIRDAFLIAHQAIKEATFMKISELIEELDPDRIQSYCSDRMSFGLFRKQDYFEAYKKRFQQYKDYLESGRLMDDYLRKFEKICQRLYREKGR